MKVYVVHDTSEVLIHGVFFSKQKAEEVAKRLTEKNKYRAGFWVEEYEVDED